MTDYHINLALDLHLPAGEYVMPRRFRVPSAGKFVQLKHDFECAEANPDHPYKPRDAAIRTDVPETIHFQSFEAAEFVPMNQEVQEWMLRVLMIGAPCMDRVQAISCWHELTRDGVAFTDRHSWTEGFADYLAGVNLGGKPMAWKMLGCGGNICKVISGNVIEAIDYTQPLPDPEQLYRDKPWLFQWATQATWTEAGRYQVVDGVLRKVYLVRPFPQFSPANVLFPIFGAGGRNRIMDTWRMKPVENGAEYSPYVE